MRLLITTYPELAKMALDRCMGTNRYNYGPDKKGVIILGKQCDVHGLKKPNKSNKCMYRGGLKYAS